MQRAKARLRFVARWRDGIARVGLESLAPNDPLAAGSGTDNRVAIYSARYREQPLVIQGPGAGADVTAAALLDDVFALRDQSTFAGTRSSKNVVDRHAGARSRNPARNPRPSRAGCELRVGFGLLGDRLLSSTCAISVIERTTASASSDLPRSRTKLPSIFR